MKFLTLTLFATLFSSAFTEDLFQFKGKHWIASYVGCDEPALTNVEKLQEVMQDAVLSSGATVLDKSAYVFEGSGLTMVFLLSESHASIHTYPEHGACFIDLFTCGDHCDYKAFADALERYLKPSSISQKVLVRQEDFEEVTTSSAVAGY